MSKLQKMRHETFTNDHEIITHVINSAMSSGEYTVYGLDIVSSTLYYNEFERVGEPYEDKLKEVTCSECLTIINFIKNLK